MIERLELLEKRYNEINEELLKPEILSDFSKQKKLSKEKGSIEEAVIKYGEYKALNEEISEFAVALSDYFLLALGFFAPYLERPCLRPSTP